MSNEVTTRFKGGNVANFTPQKAKANDAKADAIIDYAKKVKDWPTLMDAVDKKIEDQREFLRWWHENVTARQGGGEKLSRGAAQKIEMTAAEDLTGIKHQQVSKWKRRLQEPDKYRDMLYGSAYHKAMCEVDNTTATKWTGDPESYTPAEYVEAARKVMGSIDLDPASNQHAQETVKAKEWYDEEENGLLQEWDGNVFLNPPYSHPEIRDFIDKLCSEHGAKRVPQAVLLTNNNTDTKWWHLAAATASAVCFTLGRINFYKADGSKTQPTNGQTFFYFGENIGQFCEVFSQFGMVMEVHSGIQKREVV